MEATKPTKENPVYNDEIKTLYVVAEYWQSDLKFFDNELRFLRSLIDKYYPQFVDNKNINKTSEIAARLTQIDKNREELGQKVNGHLKQMTNSVKFQSGKSDYRETHGKLETATAEFLKKFREVKKQVFELTENIMESEKGNIC